MVKDKINHKKMELIIKGVANQKRINILYLLFKKPNLSLFDISDELGMNFKTAGQHTRRLYIAGLIDKKFTGSSLSHSVSRRGKFVLSFLRKIEQKMGRSEI